MVLDLFRNMKAIKYFKSAKGYFHPRIAQYIDLITLNVKFKDYHTKMTSVFDLIILINYDLVYSILRIDCHTTK